MAQSLKSHIVIPARLHSTRLPEKLLLSETGKPVIQHTYESAAQATKPDGVLVATDHQSILTVVQGFGGHAVMTDPDAPSGTDRVAEAAATIPDADIIVNVQGDEPDIDINDIKNLDSKMKMNNSKIGTLAAKISRQEMYEDENVVKVKIREPFNKNSFPFAENFMRKSKNKDNVFHHLGIYCYELQTLKKFISFNQSKNEIENKLEQLRALDNNININVAQATKSPIGVDTEEDYLAIKKIMKYK